MSSHSNEASDGGRATGPLGADNLFEEFEPVIKQILAVLRVSRDVREDCYQAACLGLIKAEKRRHKAKFFKSYAIRCIKNEIIKEIANLKGCGQGIFALDKITFLLLSKYKKALKSGGVEALNLSEGRIEDLDKLLKIRRLDIRGFEYLDLDNKPFPRVE